MAMGFGCNAAGVTGCRIIDSPRERLIAILTNSFVPCNGRLPALVTLITLFFTGASSAGPISSLRPALILTFFILTGVAATFFVSRLLSATVLKGMPSSFTLELPPYRRPQIGRVIWRSILDRTLFILGRAAAVAAPAGLVIWILANVSIGDISLLARFSGYLDTIGRLMGMDGVILMAFILGLPANEIVIPIIIMAYTSQGTLIEPGNLSDLHTLLISQGWTWVTALCTMVFFLFHWPCSTTLMTIKKETGSLKWTCLAVLLPTAELKSIKSVEFSKPVDTALEAETNIPITSNSSAQPDLPEESVPVLITPSKTSEVAQTETTDFDALFGDWGFDSFDNTDEPGFFESAEETGTSFQETATVSETSAALSAGELAQKSLSERISNDPVIKEKLLSAEWITQEENLLLKVLPEYKEDILLFIAASGIKNITIC